MNICEVTAVGFKGKRIVDQKVEKVNLVTGPNTSGKSALIAAIQATLHGKVDEIGSANQKLGLISEGQANACVKLNDSTLLFCEIQKRKSVSFSRSFVTESGHRLSPDDSERDWFGDLPTCINELWSSSGEELWNYMIPRGSSETPKEVLGAIESLYRVMGGPVQSIKSVMSSSDVGDRTIRGLAAAKELMQSLKKEKAEIEAQAKEQVPSYDGPPISEVKKRLEAANFRIQEHKKALASSESRKANAEKAEYEISVINGNIQSYRGQIKSAQESIQSQEEILAVSEIAASLDNTKDGIEDFLDVAQDMRSIVLDISDQEVTDAFENFIEIATKSIEKIESKVTPREAYAQSLQKPRELTMAIVRDPKSLISDSSAKISNQKARINTLEAAIQLAQVRLEKFNEILEESDATASILDSMSLERVVNEISSMQSYLNIHQQVEAASEKADSIAGRLLANEASMEVVDRLVTSITKWRSEVIDETLAKITGYANEFLSVSGFDPIKIELVSGKRTSVNITDSSGVNVLAMAKSVKIFYGVSVCYALQRFHEIKFPVLYVEAAELDATNLKKILNSLAKCMTDGNAFVAHWLPVEPSEGVNVIMVA